MPRSTALGTLVTGGLREPEARAAATPQFPGRVAGAGADAAEEGDQGLQRADAASETYKARSRKWGALP